MKITHLAPLVSAVLFTMPLAVLSAPTVHITNTIRPGVGMSSAISWSWPDDGYDDSIFNQLQWGVYAWVCWEESKDCQFASIASIDMQEGATILSQRPEFVALRGATGSTVLNWWQYDQTGVVSTTLTGGALCWGTWDRYYNGEVGEPGGTGYWSPPGLCTPMPPVTQTCSAIPDITWDFGVLDHKAVDGATLQKQHDLTCSAAVTAIVRLDQDYIPLGDTARAMISLNGAVLTRAGTTILVPAKGLPGTFAATLSGTPSPGTYSRSAVMTVEIQ